MLLDLVYAYFSNTLKCYECTNLRRTQCEWRFHKNTIKALHNSCPFCISLVKKSTINYAIRIGENDSVQIVYIYIYIYIYILFHCVFKLAQIGKKLLFDTLRTVQL